MVLSKLKQNATASQDGIQLEATSDTGGGQNVGYIDAFDSLTYIVDVPTNDNYRLKLSNSQSMAAVLVSECLLMVNTRISLIYHPPGGWQNWQTQQGRVIALNSGTHVVTI